MPAEVTTTGRSASAARRASAAAVNGDRHWFAVHTTRILMPSATAESLCAVHEAVPEVLLAAIGDDVHPERGRLVERDVGAGAAREVELHLRGLVDLPTFGDVD